MLIKFVQQLFRKRPQDLPKTILVSDNYITSDFKKVNTSDLPELPGMITETEGKYLYWLASEVYSCEGDIIEVGTFLGRSTIHIAAGLSNSGKNAALQCFDHYEWVSGANWNRLLDNPLNKGDNFMPEFLRNTSAYKDIIIAKKAKITEICLGDNLIEVMVLDAPKRLKDVSAILSKIADKTIPGKTILAWQDFMHPPSFEIVVSLTPLLENIKPVHAVTSGCLIAFQVQKRWTRENVAVNKITFKNWSASYARDVWKLWASIVPPNQETYFKSGLAFLLHDLGHVEEARDELKSLLHDDKLRRKIQGWKNTSLYYRYSSILNLAE